MKKSLNRKIMVVGSHADDIEIYAGGTLLKYRDLGYEIVYVMSTNNMSGSINEIQKDGTRVVHKAGPVKMMEIRKSECAKAADALGTTPIHLNHPQRHYFDSQGRQVELHYGCDLPEGIDPDLPSILTASEDAASVERVTNLILEAKPEYVITSGVSQRNIEHFATSLLVTIAFWKAVDAGYDGGLLHWREEHTLHGEANMRWDTFIDCSGYLDRKMQLIGLHQCQMPTATDPNHGHRWLSLWKGGVCGRETAELYTWVRRPTRRDDEIWGLNAPIYGEFSGELMQNSR